MIDSKRLESIVSEAGRIAFGKNNLDSKSIGYGCHENYLVSSELGRYEKVLIALACPVLLALSTPWLLLFLVLFSAFLAALTGYMLAFLLVRFALDLGPVLGLLGPSGILDTHGEYATSKVVTRRLAWGGQRFVDLAAASAAW